MLRREINRIDVEEARLEKEKLEGYEKYRRKEILAEEYRKIRDDLKKKEEKLIGEKGRSEDKLEKRKDKVVQREGEGRQGWGGCDIAELDQDVVDAFVQKVVVWNEKRIDIEWNDS